MNAHRSNSVIVVLALVACVSMGTTTETNDPRGTHNMLVVGENTVFLSHLPMFDNLNDKQTDYTSLHRYQVMLEATFSKNGKDVTELYTRDRKNNRNVR